VIAPKKARRRRRAGQKRKNHRSENAPDPTRKTAVVEVVRKSNETASTNARLDNRMNKLFTGKLLAIAIAVGLLQVSSRAATSQWVYPGSDGRLLYKTFRAGDRIMDFSSAGYMGGGVKIPTVPVKKTVSPSGGDDTAAIQTAINEVSQMKLQEGFRGAVLLEPGIFNCSKTLAIWTSGVVLRGSGSGANGTTIKMTGAPHLCFDIGADSDVKIIGNPGRELFRSISAARTISRPATA
jgi:hypothetical protein